MMHVEDLHALLRVMGTAALRAGIGYLGNRLGRELVAQLIARRPDGPAARVLARVFDLATPQKAPAPRPPMAVPANTNASSKFLDERQLCDELGISPVTATKWRGNAEGPPFIRVGRLIRYARAAVEGWLAERTVGVPRKVS
jgi:predicted DNA-binding transcriptional regulator AlpA